MTPALTLDQLAVLNPDFPSLFRTLLVCEQTADVKQEGIDRTEGPCSRALQTTPVQYADIRSAFGRLRMVVYPLLQKGCIIAQTDAQGSECLIRTLNAAGFDTDGAENTFHDPRVLMGYPTEGYKTLRAFYGRATSQKDLNAITKTLLNKNRPSSAETVLIRETLSDLIEKKFGVPPQIVEDLLRAFDHQLRWIGAPHQKTLTDVVLHFDTEEGRVWLKVGFGPRKDAVTKETEYYRAAWTHPLMRVFSPHCINYVLGERWAAHFTYDAQENWSRLTPQERSAYQQVRIQLFSDLSHEKKIDVKKVLTDPLITDVFHCALSHVLLKSESNNEVFRLYQSPSILSYETIEARIERGKPALALLRLFGKNAAPYKTALADLQGHKDQCQTIIHGDLDEENIVGQWRAHIDAGNSRPGSPEFDLSRLPSSDYEFHAECYLFFAQRLPHYLSRDGLIIEDNRQFVKTTQKLAFIDAVRRASSDVVWGRQERAQRNLERAEYLSRFIK